MGSPSIQRWLHIVGGGLALAGVIFVGIRLSEYASEIDLSRLGISALVVLGGLAILYGAANILLARAWWCQLLFLDVNTEWTWALKTYGISQLGKYVPGNIFHLAGRQALGMAAGLKARPLANSLVWELASITLAGSCFAVLVLPLIWSEPAQSAMSLIFIGVVATLYAAMSHVLAKAIAAAFLWQIFFLILSGFVFFSALTLVTDFEKIIPLAPAICGAYVVAWLAGLLTPGAPAGVGIRELAILFFLDEVVSQESLLLAVVLGRMITVIGDLSFFSVASILKKNSD